LDKDGKATQVIQAALPQLQAQFPNIDFSPLLNALPPVDLTTGKPVTWVIDDADNENKGGGNDDMPGEGFFAWIKNNPLLAAGIAGGVVYIATQKKRKRRVSGAGAGRLLMPGLAVAAILLIASKGDTTGGDVAHKRDFLKDAFGHEVDDILDQMTRDEIADVYTFVVNYNGVGNNVPEGPLKMRLLEINKKYNLFT